MNKNTELSEIVHYDLRSLAEILEYPGNEITRKPPEDKRPLIEYYTWRDNENSSPERAWNAVLNLVGNNGEKFGYIQAAIDCFSHSDILIGKDINIWAIRYRHTILTSKQVNQLQKGGRHLIREINIVPYIDLHKCKPFFGGITDLLCSRWGGLTGIEDKRFLLFGIDYNPFKRIALKNQKPVTYDTLHDCWRIVEIHWGEIDKILKEMERKTGEDIGTKKPYLDHNHDFANAVPFDEICRVFGNDKPIPVSTMRNFIEKFQDEDPPIKKTGHNSYEYCRTCIPRLHSSLRAGQKPRKGKKKHTG
jgi:hypothetical protein